MDDVKKFNLCINCLRQGHELSNCRLGSCRKCKKRHNTLLHKYNDSSNYNTTEAVVTFSKQYPSQIILSTAIIEVYNPSANKVEKVRALLDYGSQCSFITKSLKQNLQLKSNPIEAINISGIGNTSCNRATECCTPTIKSINSSHGITLSCLVLDELTGVITGVNRIIFKSK